MTGLPVHPHGLDLEECRERLRYAAEDIRDPMVATSHVSAYAALQSAEALLAAVERVLELDAPGIAAGADVALFGTDSEVYAGIDYALAVVRAAIRGEA
jgi:hypothetical protein